MMKKLIITGLLAGFCLVNVTAQTGKQIKADNSYEGYSFNNAIDRYEGLSDQSTDVLRKLADSHFKTGDLLKAETVYSDLVMSSERTADDLYNYASVLKMNKKYEESQEWMALFNKENPSDSRGKIHVDERGFYQKLQMSDENVKITNLDINTSSQDFGTSYYGDDMVVFASSRSGVRAAKRIWNWNEKPFLDMYKADRSDSYDLSDLKSFKKGLNKKYHEGPAAFNKGGDFMVFTRNNYNGKSSDDVIKLQLFTSQKVDGEWSDPQPMRFNSNEYSVGHATLTEDGKTMYFASDMPGGYGGVDIYKTTMLSDGSWTAPENMGEKMNTEGNEMFPFIHPDGVMFFASNGHLGLGGLDIFMSNLSKDGVPTSVDNLGAPLNSNMDDFALILNREQSNGYFTSNREGGKGDDDIYSFKMEEPIELNPVIAGIAKDSNGAILPYTEVKLFNLTTNEEVGVVTTGDDGSYEFDAEPEMEYQLMGAKEEYFDGMTDTDTNSDEQLVEADVILEKDPGLSIYCLVTDAKNSAPIKDVTVEITNKKTGESETIMTDLSGDFLRPLIDNKLNDEVEYDLSFAKEGYLGKSVTYKKKLTAPGIYNIHEELDVSLTPVNVGDDLGKLIDIDMIYFDFNKFNIRTDASIELNKIVSVMNEYPNMEIELGSHTDCRGKKSYNEWLSDERAKASAKYIQSKISNPSRIYGKGYGETNPVNGCECEGAVKSDCSDEEHQLNRRTEFKIIKM